MSFLPLTVDWRSLDPRTSSPGETLPAELSTPALAWDYGAVSEPLQSTSEQGVIRLRLQVHEGVAGLAVLALNYGAMLTTEATIRPDDGVAERLIAFPASFGPCRLLLRTFDDNGPVAATIFEIARGEVDDLSDDEATALHQRSTAATPPPLEPEVLAWTPSRAEPFTPISIGNTCEAKFQIARVLTFRRDPDASELAFRLSMLPPKRAEDRFGWELFDWQGTSLKALHAYFERDFENLFERADLEPFKNGVVHRELNTEHMHDFEYLLDDPRADVTPEVVDKGYTAARARFDVMKERFRALLHRPGPFLYVHVCEDIPTEWDVHRLFQALRARSPAHRFRLLFVGYEGSDTPWGDFAHAVADKAFRPTTWAKPQGRDWEGSDEDWDQALAPYRLIFPDGFVTEAAARTGDAEAPPIVPPDPSC